MGKQYGYTAMEPTPAYINVTALDDGQMRISVRSSGNGGATGPVASISLSRAEYAKLREAMLEVAQP